MIKNAMRPVHPGEILRVPAPRINDAVRGKRGVSIDTALRLARFFNNTPEFWLNLQIAYDLKVTKAKKQWL